jgi:Asp-tRNA(Asn)/Glu-tRNA(Gln) amidotransferase A subunit family amidase
VERHGEAIGERIRGFVERARSITPARYAELLARREALRHAVRAAAADCDGLITLPASGIAPLGHAHTGSRTFLAYWSGLGFPTFSLPLLSVGGLPLGVQWMGVDGQDGALAATANWAMRTLV